MGYNCPRISSLVKRTENQIRPLAQATPPPPNTLEPPITCPKETLAPIQAPDNLWYSSGLCQRLKPRKF